MNKKVRPFKWTYDKASAGNGVSSLTVSASIRIPFTVTITKEKAHHRKAKEKGFVAEAQSGEAAFDAEYFIESEAPMFTESLLGDPCKRDAINEIFSAGFTKVEFTPAEVTAVKVSASLDGKEEHEALASSAGEHLVRLTENIPMASKAEVKAVLTRRMKSVGFSSIFSKPICYAGLVMMIIAGFTLFAISMEYYVPVFDFPVKDEVVAISGVALFIFMLKAVKFFNPDKGFNGGELLAVLVMFSIGFFLTVEGGAMYLNGKQDTSPKVAHKGIVTSKEKLRSGTSATYSYHMNIKSWVVSDGEIEIQIEEDFYNRLKPNETYVKIVTRAGWLGQEWIVSYSVARQ
ncbi:MAG: hypothetical protein OEZ04_05935 [Nitrospinota bacterium]|nr:hypothetical protein [Nitrospinota bacterium]